MNRTSPIFFSSLFFIPFDISGSLFLILMAVFNQKFNMCVKCQTLLASISGRRRQRRRWMAFQLKIECLEIENAYYQFNYVHQSPLINTIFHHTGIRVRQRQWQRQRTVVTTVHRSQTPNMNRICWLFPSSNEKRLPDSFYPMLLLLALYLRFEFIQNSYWNLLNLIFFLNWIDNRVLTLHALCTFFFYLFLYIFLSSRLFTIQFMPHLATY